MYYNLLKKIKIHIENKTYITIRKIDNIYFINNNINKNKIFKSFFLYKYVKILKHHYIYNYIFYFLRIIWRGKAYRVRLFKKKSKFTLNFGHSHWYKILYIKNKINFFKIRRQNYLTLFSERNNYNKIFSVFNNIRKYNKYTKRGIRLKKTFFLRRFGKISQVNSILHNF